MGLEIREREVEGIRVLDLEGRLVAGEEVERMRAALNQLLAAGHRQIVLNLAGVDYIDSTGLGSLVVCFGRVQEAGGALKLLHLNRRAIELLVLTKLTTVFEVFDDERDAINSFFPGRRVRRFDILEFVERMRRSEDAGGA